MKFSFLLLWPMWCDVVLMADKIAIVGSGIGGSSAAYFLSKLLPDAEIKVQILIL